jgi:putative MFS transporter
MATVYATSTSAAGITARLDRLPPSRSLWTLVVLLSVGACFELYDLLMTAYVSPGLVRAGIFEPGHKGFLGLPDQAAFASITFLGLFVGTIGFGYVADRYGRRAIFTYALLWYSAATLIMACCDTRAGVDIWRFIAGIGVGVELVTIDSYLAELVPKHMRGRTFAVNHIVQFCSVPLAALMGFVFVPIDPFGVSGWRFVAAFPAVAGLLVWYIRRRVPESPRWLAQHGRTAEAERITAAMEAKVAAELRITLPPPRPTVAVAEHEQPRFIEIWRPPYRRRTIMMIVFNFCQAIGFYGFGNWVPQLLAAQGAGFTKSLQYSLIIALASPTTPILFLLFADRFERKWQIVAAACCTACFGLLFTLSNNPLWLMACGIVITGSNNLLSYSYHSYQVELFPTRLRARAVGFVYSFSRLSTVLNSFVIAFFLTSFGTTGVFGYIGAAMLLAMLSVGLFGPRTRGLALEEISH